MLKILGVTINSDASFKSHIETLASRLRTKNWASSRLRKNGLFEEKLHRTYKRLVRPTVEHAAPSWHSMITAGQAAALERQQRQALKNIYGPTLSANKLREKAGLETMSRRSRDVVRNFANKCLTNRRCWWVV